MNVTFDFGKLATIKEPEYKHVGQAMHEASEAIATAMRAAMSGTVFPGMTRAVKKTALSEHGVHRSDSGLFEFSVQTPEEIEQAVAPYDMKPGLLNGPRHRVGKNGPYTIVPFKHKGADLPGAVAQMAAQLTLSQIIGEKLEVRSDDQWEIMRNTYHWGANLGKQENRRHSNMYRFGDDKYITFRTVSAKSAPSSWWHPGFPANPVADSIWKLLEPAVTWKVTSGWREAIMEPWR